MKNGLKILFAIFFGKLLVSSCGILAPNSCPQYERVFNDLELMVYDNSGDDKVAVFQELPKTSLSIELKLFFESTTIGENRRKEKTKLKNLGFTKLIAEDCIPYYNDVEIIDSISIFVVDAVTDSVKNVTDNFKYKNYKNEIIDVNESIESFLTAVNYENNLLMPINLIETTNIPDKAKFQITVYIKTSEDFVEETGLIEFID